VARSLAKASTVGTARVALPTPERIEASIDVAADPATVFSYFTVPAKLVQWLGRSARIRPVPHGEFQVQTSEGTWIRGTFLELDAPRRLAMALPVDNANPAAGTSRVEVSLAPRRGGTVVRVVHTGVPPSAALDYRAAWDRHLTRLSRAAAEIRPAARKHSARPLPGRSSWGGRAPEELGSRPISRAS
jgi:uncharacterized protein YndB with AHSA1/START domain